MAFMGGKANRSQIMTHGYFANGTIYGYDALGRRITEFDSPTTFFFGPAVVINDGSNSLRGRSSF